MTFDSQKLYIEINNYEFIFIVLRIKENNDSFELIHKNSVPIQGIKNEKITDFDLVFNLIKKNLFTIEQKLKFVFKDVILLINNFECSIINFTGFQKLNGSQLVKENVTYIINTLKTKINEFENHKTILHIFNSKSLLDKKKMDNIPIGLFGNLYTHELSFFLIDSNDFKNIQKIFEKCNLKVKKIISKNFIEGATLINKNNFDTFLKLEIGEDTSKIVFFEDSVIKFFQNFNFGTNLIVKDVSKITGLDHSAIINILSELDYSNKLLDSELIEKKFFKEKNFRKIKKSLIFDIIKARVSEYLELMITKNINLVAFIKNDLNMYFYIPESSRPRCIEEIFLSIFSNNQSLIIKNIKNFEFENLYENTNRLVQYGWKKEAVPIVQEKKSLISRLFDKFFN